VSVSEKAGKKAASLVSEPAGGHYPDTRLGRFRRFVDEVGAPNMLVPPPSHPGHRRIVFFLTAVINTWAQKNASRMAGAIAYFGAFSFAPLLIIAAVIAGRFFGQDQVRELIVDRINDFVSADVAQTVSGILEAAAQPEATRLATIIGFVALFFGASSVFIHVQQSLADIFGTPRLHRNGFIAMIFQRLIAFAAAIGIGLLVMAAVVANTTITSLQHLLPDQWEELGLEVLSPLASAVLLIMVFAVMYQFMTRRRHPWRAVWAGSALATVLLALGTLLFGLFVSNVALGSVYGAASTLLVLLLFFYYLAMILLFGAAYTKVLGDRVRAYG
jgi:membrane protein